MSTTVNASTNNAGNGAPGPNEKLPKELVNEMQAIFGKHPGYRTSTYNPTYD
jgi:catalase